MLVCRNFSEKCLDNPIDDDVVTTQMFENTRDIIMNWLDGSDENLVIDSVDDLVLASVLKTIFRQAPAAGGLVVINDSLLAIRRNGTPDLPKGHIEDGESPEVAAMREVREETAVSDLKIIRELEPTYHCYLLDNRWTMKKTSWFLMSSDEGFNPKPQQEEGISEVYLLNKDNVDDFLSGTYSSLRCSLEKVIREVLE